MIWRTNEFLTFDGDAWEKRKVLLLERKRKLSSLIFVWSACHIIQWLDVFGHSWAATSSWTPSGLYLVFSDIYGMWRPVHGVLEQRWKKRQTLKTCLCYFSQLVLIFRPRALKTMREECFTHCIISTRAISTSAININNAFCRFFIVLLVIYAVLSQIFDANIFGPFLYLCYLNRFFHLCDQFPKKWIFSTISEMSKI